MDRLAYTALMGSSETNHPRQQLSNELANLSTIGFKRSFTNAMKSLKISGPGFDTRFQPTNMQFDRVSLAPGPLMATGNPLDVTMNGNSVLGVSASNGDLAFTRRGDLRVNSAGQLEIGSGQAVRGQNGPINAPPGYAMEIAGDGSVYASNPDKSRPGTPLLVGRLLLRDASATPLERREDGLLQPMSALDAAKTIGNLMNKNLASQTVTIPGGSQAGRDIADGDFTPSVTSGALEGSNVTSFEAMTRLIDFSRSFEAHMKVIKDANALEETGASMIKAS